MQIRIDKRSAIPIGQQLSEQIVFSIAAGGMKAGDSLPSVRAMAMRLRVSPTTVSKVYADLVRRLWVKRQRGRRMIVRAADRPLESGRTHDLDDLIDAAIHGARERGYSLQELRNRVQERLLAGNPDHILILEDESGMRRLLHEELDAIFPSLVESASPEAITGRPGVFVGALVVCLPGRLWRVAPMVPRGHSLVSLAPSVIDTYVEWIRALKEPVVVGVASVSPLFLKLSHSLLAPVVGRFHAVEEHLLDPEETKDLSALDIVLSDTAARRNVRARRIIHYPLISDSVIKEISRRIS
jgi:GntR family transcriptional regulator